MSQMAPLNLSRNDFYVYALLREDGRTPFYIGKGCGRRWLTHETSSKKSSNKHKNNIINRMMLAGIKIPKIKLAEHLTDEVAKQVEVDLILLIGRRPGGPLTNRTRGGDGPTDVFPSLATRAKMSAASKGRPKSREHRANLSVGQRRRVYPPEHGQKLIGLKRSSETREKLRVIARNRPPISEATREKMRQRPVNRRSAGSETAAARNALVRIFEESPGPKTLRELHHLLVEAGLQFSRRNQLNQLSCILSHSEGFEPLEKDGWVRSTSV